MENKIAIIGQGYVGLPLAAAFGKLYSTIGFNIDGERIIQLIKNITSKEYQAGIIAVAHQEFLAIDFQEFKNNHSVIFDTKSIIDIRLVDARL